MPPPEINVVTAALGYTGRYLATALLGHHHITTTRIYDKRRRTTEESASHDVPI